MANDPDVEIVYIASPHSHHYQNAMLCLEAGKHMLCENASMLNAAQAKALVAKARERDLFLMEGPWVRYFSVSVYVRDVIASGRIGPVERVLARTQAWLRPIYWMTIDISCSTPPSQVAVY